MLKKVAFTLYPITDVERARHFYETILGLKPGLEGGQGEKVWIEYDLEGGGCFAISNATPDAPSAKEGGTIAFEVDDLDASAEHLRNNDVKILVDDFIRGPRCRMLPIADPDGNSLVLHQLDPAKDDA